MLRLINGMIVVIILSCVWSALVTYRVVHILLAIIAGDRLQALQNEIDRRVDSLSFDIALLSQISRVLEPGPVSAPISVSSVAPLERRGYFGIL